MSRVIIIGAGGVATVAAHKVVQNPDVFTEVMIASRTQAKCDKLVETLKATYKGKNIPELSSARVDADSVEELVALLNSYKPELVINLALPYQDLTIVFCKLASNFNISLTSAWYTPGRKHLLEGRLCSSC